jgi:hypothetical protein
MQRLCNILHSRYSIAMCNLAVILNSSQRSYIHSYLKIVIAIIIIMITVGYGVYFLFYGYAATPYTSSYATSGALTKPATTISNSLASNGGAVVFDAATMNSCSSPFAASYFCRPVANDPVLSNSAALVSSFVSAYTDNYGAVDLNNGDYGIPIYRVSSTQTLSAVSFDTANSGCSGHGTFPTMEVPIPTGAVGAGGTDGSAIIYQASTGDDWELWQFENTGNGTYGACAGAEISGVSTNSGVFPANDSQLSASGISYLATLITETDIQNGAINHALALAIPVCAAGYVAPARSSDCGGPGVIQEGNYFRFPANLTMPPGLTPIGQLIFKAIQTYGMVDIDFAGSVGIGAEEPIGWQLSGNNGDPITSAMNGEEGYQAIANLPWSSLQAISPPNL